jgi:hypothetical protein
LKAAAKGGRSQELVMKIGGVQFFENTLPSMDALLGWDFDPSKIPDKDLVEVSLPMMEFFGVFDIFDCGTDQFRQWAIELRNLYLDKAYHNWQHGFMVMHISFLLMVDICQQMDDLGDDVNCLQFLEVDRAATLIAALGHDVGHRGMANGFEVATSSDLAINYNDVSVLENHHAATTCRLLQSHELMNGMAPSDKKRARAVIVHSILGTDMVKHKSHIVWLQSHRVDTQLPDEDMSKEVCCSILHCGDLAHPVKPWPVHKQLTIDVCTEFFLQFQEETRQALPTLPFMGHDPKDLSGLAPLQLGFLDFVANPVWLAMNMFTKEGLQYACTNLKRNRGLWDRMTKGEEVEDEQPFENAAQGKGAREMMSESMRKSIEYLDSMKESFAGEDSEDD